MDLLTFTINYRTLLWERFWSIQCEIVSTVLNFKIYDKFNVNDILRAVVQGIEVKWTVWQHLPPAKIAFHPASQVFIMGTSKYIQLFADNGG